MNIDAYVFDAYGTLIDLQSVSNAVKRACPGRGEFITQIWRLKQLEYSWLRTCMDIFVDFETVTRESLAYALDVAHVNLSDALVRDLASEYLRLALLPDARQTLAALAGRPRVILSNGSANMLSALIEHSSIGEYLEHVISADQARAFKTSPRVYALVEHATRVRPEKMLFVSSNGFDVVGAKHARFEVAWVRRGGTSVTNEERVGPIEMFRAQRLNEKRLGFAADHVIDSLGALLVLR